MCLLRGTDWVFIHSIIEVNFCLASIVRCLNGEWFVAFMWTVLQYSRLLSATSDGAASDTFMCNFGNQLLLL